MLLFFLFSYLLFVSSQPIHQLYTVTNTNGNWKVTSGSGGIADADYRRSMPEIGWDVLSITTAASYPDDTQAYGAGYLEGAITFDRNWNAWLGQVSPMLADANLIKFVTQQDAWVREQAKQNAATDGYWAQVALVLAQFDGLVKGYGDYASVAEQLSYVQQLEIQLQPELGDIYTHLQLITNTYDPESYDFESHCSVLIKPSADGRQLFTSHDTWSDFASMLRIYKYYNLNYNLPSNAAPRVAFSSYPGNLESIDDFYMTSQQLHVGETTNEILNSTLYLDYISTETVPEWIRIIVANRMAVNGQQWSETFARYNSGTYNNQWQIVDYKLFTPGQPLKPGTLYIFEQVPGTYQYGDETSVLSTQGYFPSYNIPFYEYIYNISGYPSYYTKYGNEYSYTECARARIFRRDQPGVQTIEDMKRIMRYNEYQTDEFALWDACRGISARCDLNTPWSNNTMNGWAAFGGIDSKITDNLLIQNMTAWAVSGPSWDSQPVFAWTKTWAQVPHYGMPDIYDFTWQLFSPN